MVMDLKEGLTLSKILQIHKKCNLEFVVHVSWALANILKYVEGEGWVYRDLKASNIHVTIDGKVHLVDFGLSKKINGGISSNSMVSHFNSAIFLSRKNQKHLWLTPFDGS